MRASAFALTAACCNHGLGLPLEPQVQRSFKQNAIRLNLGRSAYAMYYFGFMLNGCFKSCLSNTLFLILTGPVFYWEV